MVATQEKSMESSPKLHTQEGAIRGTLEHYVIYPKLNHVVLLREDIQSPRTPLVHAQFFIMTGHKIR